MDMEWVPSRWDEPVCKTWVLLFWLVALPFAELKVSVSFDDARRAVGEAKQHAKSKAAAMLQASNKTWSDKLAAARAETQLLHEQLQDLQQQRDQLAQQVRQFDPEHLQEYNICQQARACGVSLQAME